MEESTNSVSSFARSSNVLPFPKKNIRLVPPVEDDIAREIANRKYVDEAVESYAIKMLNTLAEEGFDIQEDRFDKHFGFTMETLRSTLLLTMKLDHPLQEIIEHTVKIIEKIEADAANDDNEFDPA